jgi:hypothetical protein
MPTGRSILNLGGFTGSENIFKNADTDSFKKLKYLKKKSSARLDIIPDSMAHFFSFLLLVASIRMPQA